MDTQTRISVVRQSSDDVGYRQIFVTLDGDDFAVLRHGGGATREIAAGPHVLKVHNTLFRKQVEFELQVGEHAHFVVVNRAGFGTHFLTGILGAGPVYLTVERESLPV